MTKIPQTKTENLEPYLCQGDIIVGYSSEKLLTFDQTPVGYIVLNYTCDLKQNEDLRSLLIAPIIKMDFFFDGIIKAVENGYIKQKKSKGQKLPRKKKIIIQFFTALFQRFEQFSKYEGHSFYLLFPNSFFDYFSLVDITNIINLDTKELNELIKFRKCSLCEPWKEKLGFMVGSIFNRIAVDDPDEGDFKLMNDFVELKYKERIEEICSNLK